PGRGPESEEAEGDPAGARVHPVTVPGGEYQLHRVDRRGQVGRGGWFSADVGTATHARRRCSVVTQRTVPSKTSAPRSTTETWVAASRAKVLYLADVRSLQPFRTAGDFELDLITFGEALEALRLDGRVVDEHVLAALLRDEAETLRVVEPLHPSGCHDLNLSSGALPLRRFRRNGGASAIIGGQTKNAARTGCRTACISDLETLYRRWPEHNEHDRLRSRRQRHFFSLTSTPCQDGFVLGLSPQRRSPARDLYRN